MSKIGFEEENPFEYCEIAYRELKIHHTQCPNSRFQPEHIARFGHDTRVDYHRHLENYT